MKGRHLAPFMYQFDNLHEIEELARQAMIPWEDVSIDYRTGIIHIPNVGAVGIGQYLVESPAEYTLLAFDTIRGLQTYYEVVG